MGPVFGHGQLRLYLLAVLEAGPRSGYDVIRGLEDRFGGLYSPSAGTVYPRLAKLEEEGLVTRSDEGRRSLYSLTAAGQAELDGRRAELSELELSLDESAQRLAEQMRERVRSGTADVRARLEEAARQARARARESAAYGAGEGVLGGEDAGRPEGAAGHGGSWAGPAGAWGRPTSGGPGPFVPPGFGTGFPFGQGTPDWSSVARWLGEMGFTPPTGAPRPADPRGPQAGAGRGSASSAGAGSSADAGAGSGSGEDSSAAHREGVPPRRGARDVWAQATDTVDEAATARAQDTAAPGAGPRTSARDTGTGWPGAEGDSQRAEPAVPAHGMPTVGPAGDRYATGYDDTGHDDLGYGDMGHGDMGHGEGQSRAGSGGRRPRLGGSRRRGDPGRGAAPRDRPDHSRRLRPHPGGALPHRAPRRSPRFRRGRGRRASPRGALTGAAPRTAGARGPADEGPRRHSHAH